MARSRRTHHTGQGWTPCIAMDAKPVRQQARVALRKADAEAAELPGTNPRQVRLSRLLRTPAAYRGPYVPAAEQ